VPKARASERLPDVQTLLEEELRRLKEKSGLGYGLEVTWMPDGPKDRAGEVKRNVILVYEKEPEAALKTLRHEFVDWLVSQVTRAHKQLVNKLLELLELQLYVKKEKVVQAILNLLAPSCNGKDKVARDG